MSKDNSLAEFQEYYAEMLWAAVPYTPEKLASIVSTFGVTGIPQVLVLRASDGSKVLEDARDLISRKKRLAGIFE